MRRRIILLGPPAAGKGTQAEKLQLQFGMKTTSPGAILRLELREGTELGIEADRYTGKGQLAPDSLILPMLRNALARDTEGVIFDGFPRTVPQAVALDEMLGGHGPDAAVLLDVDLDEIRDRVMHRLACTDCGRSFSLRLQLECALAPCPQCGGALVRRGDDDPAALEQRMAEYAAKTEPLINYYEARNLLFRVDGCGTPEEVFSRIEGIVK